MIEFILFAVVCVTIFMLVNAFSQQVKVKTMQQPIRIETEEELRKRKSRMRDQFKK